MSVASLAGSRERAHSRVAASSACRPSLLRGCVCTLQTGSIIATACTGTHPHHPYEAASFVRHLLGTSLPQLRRASVQQARSLHLSTFPVLRASSHSSCSTGRALAAGTSLSLPHSLSPHYFQVSEVPQGHPLTSAKLCWKVRALRLARHNKNARGQPLARALFNTRRDPSPARPASRPSAPRRLRPARRSCP
jgi:hypothetical protein